MTTSTKKKEVQHTPTKFIAGDPDGDIYPILEKVRDEFLTVGYAMTEEGQSFIVRCVNSHKAMAEALDSAYALLVEFSELASWQDKDYKVLREIEKAIAQAEGK